MAKPGRNEPCPCGSEQKYKRCCLNAPPPPMVEPETEVLAPAIVQGPPTE